MEYKKYSAFVSSHFTSLKKERTELISGLLDAQMIPICMEHFTVTTSEKFDDIKETNKVSAGQNVNLIMRISKTKKR